MAQYPRPSCTCTLAEIDLTLALRWVKQQVAKTLALVGLDCTADFWERYHRDALVSHLVRAIARAVGRDAARPTPIQVGDTVTLGSSNTPRIVVAIIGDKAWIRKPGPGGAGHIVNLADLTASE